MDKKKINDIEIKPIISKKTANAKTIRGYNFFKEPYANVCILARKNSGKSTVIYRALEECATKGTNVMIFCSTINLDETYKKMVKMLEKKKCNVSTHEHFIENGVNLLDQLIKILQKKAEDETKDEEKQENKVKKAPIPVIVLPNNCKIIGYEKDGSAIIEGNSIPPKQVKKQEKSKMITPENIFVFDDLSTEMAHPSISKLLTIIRHTHSKCIISAHNVNSIAPMGLRMIDVFCLFPNISDEKIQEVCEKVGLMHKGDTKKRSLLQELYNDATSEPHNFLYIDRGNGEYRKNFNQVYKIED